MFGRQQCNEYNEISTHFRIYPLILNFRFVFFFKLFEQSCISPAQNLENHVLWGDIMILSRYLLMLSFNNCLDVIQHLPYLFHTVTFLVNSGPVNMKASIHGLVINVIHSLCTCSEPTFSGTYLLIGIDFLNFEIRILFKIY